MSEPLPPTDKPTKDTATAVPEPAATEPEKNTPPAAAEATAPKPDSDTTEKPDTRPEAAAQKPATPASARRKKILDLLTDSLLVLALTAAIGATGYYLKKQYKRYRVPTPMELVMKENERLCQKHEELRERAFHADEQIHMRRRLAYQERRLGQDSQQIADLEASIAEQRNRILAIQHEIRSTDKEYRSVARTLLPGMPIGNATTTTGKAYRNAVIYRLDNRNVVIRTPEGQSRFPVAQLVKDNLPMLARYAFGLENLVDMSDFDTAETLDVPVKEQPLPTPPAPQPEQRAATSYEPEAGAPVVDTAGNDTATSSEGESDTSATDDGLAPW